MNPWRWVDPRVQNVRLAEVQAYLETLGWVVVPDPNPKVIRYERARKRSGDTFFRVIPASEEFPDFAQDVAELITQLSELQDRHPVSVLEDILREGAERPAGNGSTRPEPAARRERTRSNP